MNDEIADLYGEYIDDDIGLYQQTESGGKPGVEQQGELDETPAVVSQNGNTSFHQVYL